jgi:hypothetical protein
MICVVLAFVKWVRIQPQNIHSVGLGKSLRKPGRPRRFVE